MAISVFPAPSATTAGDNWVQIATATPTSGSSVSFTSIPTFYRRLWLVTDSERIILSTSTKLAIQVNSITGAEDYTNFQSAASNASRQTVTTSITPVASGSDTNVNLKFNNVPNPFITAEGYIGEGSGATYFRETLIWSLTSPITQIDVTCLAGDFTSNVNGKLTLLGTV
jgi:hypothetical protein